MRLIEGRKPEKTRDAMCGAGPTGCGGAGSTGKGSTPINQEKETEKRQGNGNQRDEGKDEQGKKEETQKLPTLYEYLMMKDEADFGLEKYNKIYEKRQKQEKQ